MASVSYYKTNDDDLQSAIRKLFRFINQNIQKLSQYVNQIETINHQEVESDKSNESKDLRDRLFDFTIQLAKDTHKQLNELNRLVSLQNNKQLRLQKEKLAKEFIIAVKNLHHSQVFSYQEQKDSNKIKKETMIFNEFHTPNPFLDDFANNESKINLSIDQNENIQSLRNREAALLRLENDINELNAIFNELNSMVNDQGRIVDTIDNNVENTHINVIKTNSQLLLAMTHKSKTRKYKFIVAIILAFVIAFIILAFYLIFYPGGW